MFNSTDSRYQILAPVWDKDSWRDACNGSWLNTSTVYSGSPSSSQFPCLMRPMPGSLILSRRQPSDRANPCGSSSVFVLYFFSQVKVRSSNWAWFSGSNNASPRWAHYIQKQVFPSEFSERRDLRRNRSHGRAKARSPENLLTVTCPYVHFPNRNDSKDSRVSLQKLDQRKRIGQGALFVQKTLKSLGNSRPLFSAHLLRWQRLTYCWTRPIARWDRVHTTIHVISLRTNTFLSNKRWNQRFWFSPRSLWLKDPQVRLSCLMWTAYSQKLLLCGSMNRDYLG